MGSWSDGSSTDKLSLDPRVNPWDTAVTHRPDWHSMSKTIFAQYDPSGSWCTEQSVLWLDDVKTFCHRPIRCVAKCPPIFYSTTGHRPVGRTCTPRAKTYIDVSSLSPDLYKDKHATLNRRQNNVISSSETFVTETKQVSRNLLTNIISCGRTITYMTNSAVGADKKAI